MYRSRIPVDINIRSLREYHILKISHDILNISKHFYIWLMFDMFDDCTLIAMILFLDR